MTEPREYQIWSYEHNGWWKPGRWGYTPYRNEAGLYTESEAADICLEANRYLPKGQVHEVMVHQNDVFKAKEPA